MGSGVQPVQPSFRVECGSVRGMALQCGQGLSGRGGGAAWRGLRRRTKGFVGARWLCAMFTSFRCRRRASAAVDPRVARAKGRGIPSANGVSLVVCFCAHARMLAGYPVAMQPRRAVLTALVALLGCPRDDGNGGNDSPSTSTAATAETTVGATTAETTAGATDPSNDETNTDTGCGDVDLLNDPMNCGECGFSCPVNDVPQWICCNGECKHFIDDPDNCGDCGTVCKNRCCSSGECADFSSDPRNCGSCENRCELAEPPKVYDTCCEGQCIPLGDPCEECGNGIVNEGAGETCDDRGESSSCDSDCTEAQCGDGVVNNAAGEACDDGNGANSDDCLDTCQQATCGDGYIWTDGRGNEICDGKNLDGQTCLSISPEFGGGVLECQADCGGFDTTGCCYVTDSECLVDGQCCSGDCINGSQVCA